MSREIITIEMINETIGVFHFNDPEHHNTFTEQFIDQFLVRIQEAAENRSLKALILRGMESVFAAGADKNSLMSLESGTMAVKDLVLSELVIGFPVPVIAAMEGHAIGGGLVLGLCADIILMDEKSNYGTNFMKMGFTPGMGATRLLQGLVGDYIANEMLFTGKTWRGKSFVNRGLVNYILPKSEVYPKALNIAMEIAEKPRKSLEILKYSLSLRKRNLLMEARVHEDFMHQISFAQPDVKKIINEAYNG